LGAGVNFQILSTKNSWLKFAISSEYEQTDFAQTNFNRSEYDGKQSISTYRGTFWANGKYKLFEKKLIFNHEFYIQPSLGKSNNFRWQADLGLELPIWIYLNFKINYLHTFESVVIENQKQRDNILTFGFTLKSC
jgi:hypothetical protein